MRIMPSNLLGVWALGSSSLPLQQQQKLVTAVQESPTPLPDCAHFAKNEQFLEANRSPFRYFVVFEFPHSLTLLQLV